MAGSPGFDDPPPEPVGAVLARWRKRRKLTGQALADLVGMSQAKISRLETGAVTAEPGDVRLLAQTLDMPATEVERVVALAEGADNRVTDWLDNRQLDLAELQELTARIENQAREVRIFQPAVVPGLAQTSEYARAVLSAVPDDPRDDSSRIKASEAVAVRMRRSQILFDSGREFRFVITEQVLRNRVCDPATMIAQIARLLELAAYPNVHLRIVADDAELPAPPYHGFYLADDRWVSVDLFNTMVTSRGRRTVSTYRRVFDAVEAAGQTDIGELLVQHQARYARMLLSNSIASGPVADLSRSLP